MNSSTQIQTLLTRRAILCALQSAGRIGLGLAAIKQRLRIEGTLPSGSGQDYIITQINYLSNAGLVCEEREKLCPSLPIYVITPAGLEQADTATGSAPAAAGEELFQHPKQQDNSLLLGGIKKGLRLLWKFLVWLFTDIL